MGVDGKILKSLTKWNISTEWIRGFHKNSIIPLYNFENPAWP
jgi:hypothetical protein